MTPRSNPIIVAAILALAALSAGCQGESSLQPTASPGRTALPPTDTPSTLITVAPSHTPAPSAEPSPTIGLAPTAGPDFSNASIYAVAHLESGQLQVAIQVPGGIEGVYNGWIGGNRLPCTPIAGFPDRLYCIGAEPAINYAPEGARIRLYPLTGDRMGAPLFEAAFTLPARATPTTTPLPWYPPIPSLPFP